jgi:hypothetical protein
MDEDILRKNFIKCTTIVAIRPGKHFALIAKEEVTKQASPSASAQRMNREAQKKIRPAGKRLSVPNVIAVIPVMKRPTMNIDFEPMRTI